jgi:hypothetical protein
MIDPKKKVVTTRIELVKNNILTHEDLDCSLVNVIMLLKNMTIFFFKKRSVCSVHLFILFFIK